MSYARPGPQKELLCTGKTGEIGSSFLCDCGVHIEPDGEREALRGRAANLDLLYRSRMLRRQAKPGAEANFFDRLLAVRVLLTIEIL